MARKLIFAYHTFFFNLSIFTWFKQISHSKRSQPFVLKGLMLFKSSDICLVRKKTGSFDQSFDINMCHYYNDVCHRRVMYMSTTNGMIKTIFKVRILVSYIMWDYVGCRIWFVCMCMWWCWLIVLLWCRKLGNFYSFVTKYAMACQPIKLSEF